MAENYGYGIYSTVSKRYIFGIYESSKNKARKKLQAKIGKDAFRWRFEARRIKAHPNEINAQLENKYKQKLKRKKKEKSMGEIADHYVDQFTSGNWGTSHNNYQRRDSFMSDQFNQTRIVTEEVRFSFVNLLTPRAIQDGAEPKYSVTILLPKSDLTTKAKIDAAIEAAKQIGKSKHWNNVIPPMVNIPIHDGDGVKPSDGMPFGDECKGHWVFSASTKADQPPKVVDANLNPIMDATEVYSGMYGKIALNFAPYKFSGKSGVGVYISTNVQKTRDGEPLGASAPDVSSDFGPSPAPQQGFNQAPPAQQYGQAPQQQQQYQQAPNPNAQPGFNLQHFTQPGQQPPQQQQGYGQAPQQPQIDPVTGQPINNGGVYGL
ncbi:DUF2815 family protein [Oceanobacillus neutriphilus]|uniref:DUF2815 family protein n=1 Tax=Oceanobacillus neutriphilus TaxID=531815 RepID=A0ABQ2NMR7_9BACI|nr:DUF2815 family protein [Oceanobacillus neutriphilus]GGP07334.1 hypothetical protein GCM10011346_02910 [Oceanobacillus neutriphilus]